ncbi:sigma-70 family RNA polymerase sigma factor [Hymenobacter sp. BT18]|uniref:RNA polymerase sigma factor n=1 Tax=Hymenobacter sp. BT18 TaxID=2835648 RepID=UPI00143E2DAB|nr:sigma-70 family RNA polymerase sigma factor [Hymenobacter sp. BT18]QIX59720.1 sigma-70 family RNA polymerase sigma factor [Hymenobacter sp. BT18]
MSSAVPRYSAESEANLVQRLYARDESAMTIFYSNYRAALYRVILRIVKSPDMADDVLQESMLKIWLSFAHYDAGRSRLFTWALNICQHQAIDTLRLKANRQWTKMDDIIGCIPAKQMATPAASMLSSDLATCLAYLKPIYREVLEYRFYQQMSVEETAKHLDMPLGTLKSRNREAMRCLLLIWKKS